eukprot:6078600-Alexandrium_andersonii.AAC.1
MSSASTGLRSHPIGAADATHPNQAARMPNTCVDREGLRQHAQEQVKAHRRQMCAAGAGHDE